MIETASIPTAVGLVKCLPFKPVKSHGRPFLEFFAGIGLTRLGLGPHGWNCVYANDIEEKKQRMYKSCFGAADHYQVEDVWNTDKIVARIPAEQADLASASFPCVDLSLAGNMKGLNGAQSGAFYGFLRVLQALKRLDRLPKAVLVENVIGFLASHEGKHFRVAVEAIANLGYYVDAFVVDAKYFVPQSRPRLFLLGFLPEVLPSESQVRGTQAPQPFWFPGDAEMRLRPKHLLRILSETQIQTGWVPLNLPHLPPENRTLDQVIETGKTEDWWNKTLVDKHLAEMHFRHRERIEQLRRGRGLSVGTMYRRVREGKSRSEIRTDGLAGCLRTPRGGSSKQIVFVAGRGDIRMRWMSPLEYARLQGCPDFPIEVGRNEALYGFGDAVCVPVIRWIAENALAQLFPDPYRIGQPQQAAGD